jgi:hypothetical protein
MAEKIKTPFADDKPDTVLKEEKPTTWHEKKQALVADVTAGKKVFLEYSGKAITAVSGRGEFLQGTKKEITAEEAFGFMDDSSAAKGWRVVAQ